MSKQDVTWQKILIVRKWSKTYDPHISKINSGYELVHQQISGGVEIAMSLKMPMY